MKSTIKLKVGKASYDDIGRDIVRIHKHDRPKGFERHDIVKILVGKNPRLVTIRGGEVSGIINIDIDNREDLGVDAGGIYEFELRKANLWQKIWWQWWATDPAVRLPAKIAAWSFLMGFAGLVLGIVGLVVSIKALPA